MGHLTPVLVATEAFGRDLRKVLTRHRAPPELTRELEQNFTIWKAPMRQFHDAASPHTVPSQTKFVKSSALAEWIGEKVTSEIIEDVCEREIPQLEITKANRKLAEANERIRVLEIQVRQQDATNSVIKAQNDRQADSQLTLAHNMFEEVFQLRTTIAELTAIALDETGDLAEKYHRESQKVRYQRARADSLMGKSVMMAGSMNATSHDILAASTRQRRMSMTSGGSGSNSNSNTNFKRNPVVDIVKTDYINSNESNNNIDVRSIVRPVKLRSGDTEDGGENSSSNNNNNNNNRSDTIATGLARPAVSNLATLVKSGDKTNNSNTDDQQEANANTNTNTNTNDSKPMRKRGTSFIGTSMDETGAITDVFEDPSDVVGVVNNNNNNNAHNSNNNSNNNSSNNNNDAHISPAGRRRIHPKSGGVGPYAIFDYETFVENFEKTRGAKALAQQLEELKAAFKDYVETSNLDRAGIASSFQFQLDIKDGQIKALRLALLQALGTAPTLASMVRSFMSRVLKIEVEQLKRRMVHLQKAVKTWIDHIQKHVHVMGARFDVFVRFCGNIFQEMSDHVTFAVQQRFPLAPGATYQPPPAMEPLWHFFVLKGDDDPEEEAKAYWQNHEATQSIALLQTNMCEALKEIHFALRLAAQLKNPFVSEESNNNNNNKDEDYVAFSSQPSTTAEKNYNYNNNNSNNSRIGSKKTSFAPTFGKEGRNSTTTTGSPKGINRLVSFTNGLEDDDNNNNNNNNNNNSTSGNLDNTSDVLNSSQRSSASGRSQNPQNRFALRKKSSVAAGQHTINFGASANNGDDIIQPGNDPSQQQGGRKRRIKSLYAGTSWEAMDEHRQGIELDMSNGFQLSKRGSMHQGSGSLPNSPMFVAGGTNPDIIKSLDEWTQQNGGEMFFGASYTNGSNNNNDMMTSNRNSSNAGSPFATSMSASSRQQSPNGGNRGAAAGSPSSSNPRQQRKRRHQRYDDWTIETSVENIKFLRGLSKRCVQLSVRSILSRVHLRARRQLLIKNMTPEQRNAYLTIAALDREIAHISDVIDGARGNGYLAKFRAVETEHIIQAWKSTGRRGKPVITGDSDEDDARVLPIHAPGMVPVRNLETIRGKAEGEKSKDGIQKFRATLGATGGTSNALGGDEEDDGTLGDPVKLVQEMITTGTLWAQSSFGKDSKGAYRARQDVLYELIDKETQRMKSSDGFKTRRKRRFLRMLNYLKNKVGFAESAINAARSGTKSTAVEEGTSLLKNFVDNYGIPDEEGLEIDELDPANKNYFLSRRANDMGHVRGSAGSFLPNSWGNASHMNSDGTMFGNSDDNLNGGGGEHHQEYDKDGNLIPRTNNNNNRRRGGGGGDYNDILKTARTQLRLSLAGDGSDRWKYSRKDGGSIHGAFGDIGDTITRNRSDILSLQRLGLTEDQIKLMQVQSLRSKAARPPADLKEFLMSTINMSYETADGDDDDDLQNNKTKKKKNTSEILDEAMEKLRDDLFFGRNTTELWFGCNQELWIPTPGHDLPQEMKDASRDTALRRAMTALLAIGALDLEEEKTIDENGTDTDTNHNNNDQNTGKDEKKSSGAIDVSQQQQDDKKKTTINFSPTRPTTGESTSASSPTRGIQRLGTRSFTVREASVERTDGNDEMAEAFSAHAVNRPKIIESEN